MSAAEPRPLTRRRDQAMTQPLATIFTTPKPFDGHTGMIQRHAIRSWLRLAPAVEVLVGGDDQGVAEACDELGAVHLGALRRSPSGTPRLDDLFARAHERATGEVLIYANADILFFSDLIDVLGRLLAGEHHDFLAIGRRTDLDVTTPLTIEAPGWETSFVAEARRRGSLAPVVCKDYFAFPRHLYRELPEFLVGRGNWDNWMVHHAKTLSVPVVDLTASLFAVHQNHDYGHLKRGRLEAYVTGDEARHNERVGGGKHVVSGASADWELTAAGLRRRRGGDWSRFARDLPRFLGLLGSFLTRR